MLFFIFALLFFCSLAFFLIPALSPIPYFPSNRKDAELIFKSLHLQNNQVVVELGVGDGWIIFEAARRAMTRNFNTKFIGVEINPIFYVFLQLKRLRHKNKKNIQIYFGNILTVNFQKILPKTKFQLTYYTYATPQLIHTIVDSLTKTQKKFAIISYMYPVKNKHAVTVYKGKHILYKYHYD